jgi:hypothetical protein
VISDEGGVVINGTRYQGKSVNMIDGKVYVDGKEVANDNPDSKTIKIVIEGDCAKAETTSGDITVKGNVNGEIRTTSGGVTVEKNVQHGVSTVSGGISVRGNVGGSCSSVSGSIRHSGSSSSSSSSSKIDVHLESAQTRIAELESKLKESEKKVREWKDKCLAVVFDPDGDYAKSVVDVETTHDKNERKRKKRRLEV